MSAPGGPFRRPGCLPSVRSGPRAPSVHRRVVVLHASKLPEPASPAASARSAKSSPRFIEQGPGFPASLATASGLLARSLTELPLAAWPGAPVWASVEGPDSQPPGPDPARDCPAGRRAVMDDGVELRALACGGPILVPLPRPLALRHAPATPPTTPPPAPRHL